MKTSLTPTTSDFLASKIDKVVTAQDSNGRLHAIFLEFTDFTGERNFIPLALTEDQISLLNINAETFVHGEKHFLSGEDVPAGDE